MPKKKKSNQSLPGKEKIWQISLGKVSLVNKLLFVKHLMIMIKAGMTLSEALKVLTDQAQGKFQKILRDIKRKTSAGYPLNEALADFPKTFSPIFINLIRAGELSGTLETNLEQLAIQMEKDYTLKKKIKSAMLYPIIVLILVFVVGSVIAVFILPKIIPLFKSLGADIPFTTRVLIAISDFFQTYTWKPIAFFIFIIIFLTWFLKRKFIKPFTHWFILNAPILGKISRNLNLARFARTLSTLLKSGLTIDESLTISSQVIDNYHFKKSLNECVETISAGDQLGKILKKWPKLFSPIFIRMIEVGERTGSLEETLLYLSEFFESEVDEATQNLSNILEPVLLIIIGLVVGFLAVSIITPIYEITGKIGV